jgi:hypothetical protein
MIRKYMLIGIVAIAYRGFGFVIVVTSAGKTDKDFLFSYL